MSTREGSDGRQPEGALGQGAVWGNMLALTGLVMGVFLILTSGVVRVVQAGPATLTLTLASPASGLFDLGDINAADGPSVLEGAVTYDVIVDHSFGGVEWNLYASVNAEIPGCTVERRAGGGGSEDWVVLSATPTLLGTYAGSRSLSDDFRLTVEWWVAPGAYSYSITYYVEFADVTPPDNCSVSINNGAGYTNNPEVSLTLSATDDSGYVDEMRFSNDGETWSEWQDFAESATWTLSDGDGEKTVWAMFRDAVGNESTPVWDTIIVDTISPHACSVLINDGDDYTTHPEREVTLTLSAEDDLGVVESMCFSNDGEIWSDWIPYDAAATWTLSDGDGEKTVWARFRDPAGNETAAQDSIILDTTPPHNCSILINGGDTHTNDPSGSVILALAAEDNLGVVDAMSFSVDVGTWTDWQPFAGSASLTLSEPEVDGEKTVLVRFRDRAGNVSEPASSSIVLDTTPPVISALEVDNIMSTSADVLWVTDEEATAQVRFRKDADSTWSLHLLEPSGYGLEHSVSLTDLVPGTLYHLHALSVDRAANATESPDPESPALSFWTPCEAPYLTVTVTRTGGSPNYQVRLDWTSSDNAVNYKVYRSGELLTTTTGLTYTDDVSTASGPLSYHYWVAAVNGGAMESDSNVVVVELGTDDTTPPVLTITSVSPQQTQCAITWVTDEVSTSQVMYRVKGTDTWSATPHYTTLVSEHTVTVTGLTSDTTYEFYAASEDAAGNRGESPVEEFTTLPPDVPPAPQNLRVTNTLPHMMMVDLAWDPVDTAVEYRIYRRHRPLGGEWSDWEHTHTTTSTSARVRFNNPTSGPFTNEYYVTALNALGESDPSNVVSVTKN